MHYRALGVPVAAGVGATIDFLAGDMKRAQPGCNAAEWNGFSGSPGTAAALWPLYEGSQGIWPEYREAMVANAVSYTNEGAIKSVGHSHMECARQF